MLYYVCSQCGHREPVTTRDAQCACGGLWQLDYTAPKFDPALIDRNCWSLFRYRHWLPLEGDEWKEVTMGEGMTPIVKFDDNLMLKMDYYMPTLSF